MRFEEVPIGQIEARRCDCARNHLFRSPEEVLIVRVAPSAIGEYERWLTTSSRPAAALRIVGRRGWHVPHVHGVQFRDVHSQFHGGRAIENGQIALPKRVFTLLSAIARDLRRVLLRLEAHHSPGDLTIEASEELVGTKAGPWWPRHADRVVEGTSSIAGPPEHC